MGGAVSPASERGAPSRSSMKLSTVRRPEATSSWVPTRTRTMLRMKASAVMRKARMSPSWLPAGGEDVALEADVVGLGRGEGGEVVGAGEGGGAGVEGLAVDAVRPPERPAALERARGRAGAGGGSGSCAPWRRGGRRSRRRPTAAAVTATSSGATPLRRRVRSSRRLGGGLEARHLAQGVDAGVGAPGDGQLDRLAQDRRQRRLQLALHRPQARLPRPAAEAGAVVFDVQPHRGHGGSISDPG